MNKVIVALLLSFSPSCLYAQVAGGQTQWGGFLVWCLSVSLLLGLLILLVDKKNILGSLIVSIIISVYVSISIIIYYLSKVYGVN